MIPYNELIKTPEYLLEVIQNELFRQVSDYLGKENITQTQLAAKLGVSKGYISQVMNGNFNYTLKKLIELSLAVNKVPLINFEDIKEYIKKDYNKRFEMRYKEFFVFDKSTYSIPVNSGFLEVSNVSKAEKESYTELKAA
jgi:transcriptional regulator with XRE-family HTH domain